MQWIALGKTNEEVGRILTISPRTVAKHLEHINAKFGTKSRTAAVVRLVGGHLPELSVQVRKSSSTKPKRSTAIGLVGVNDLLWYR